MSAYSDNLDKIQQFITRNFDNIHVIGKTSFWLNDVEQRIELSWVSVPNWLKIKQEIGHNCSLFPVDGNQGVFRKEGLQVQEDSRFVYEWTTENGTIRKNAGDCDCLIIDEKWRFIEFKTEASSQDIDQMDNNRNKGEAQLARSLTAFKEQLDDESLKCECVLVVPTFFSFPKHKTSLFPRKVKFLKLFKTELKEITNDGNISYDLL